jgi:hypothetical protein
VSSREIERIICALAIALLLGAVVAGQAPGAGDWQALD